VQQLSGLDGMFLTSELPGTPMNISSLMIYDPSTSPKGVVTLEDILALFANHDIPQLRKKVVEVPYDLDQPYWVEDPDFDLEHHVQHIALPSPGDWNALYALIAKIHARPMDRSRPLWEAYLIDGVDTLDGIPKGCFGLFMKIHHAAMDGQTALAIFSGLHTLSPEEGSQRARVKDPRAAEESPGYLELLSRAYLNNAIKSFQLMKTLGNALFTYRRIRSAIDAKEFSTYDDKPRLRFNGPISQHRSVGRLNVSLDDLRAIKQHVRGATINDTVLTIVGGALRKYLRAKHELPDTPLIASMPMDVRKKEDAEKGNMITATNVTLGTDVEDPMKRLRVVHQASVEAKKFGKALGRRFLFDTLQSLHAGVSKWGVRAILSSGLLEHISPIQHTVITNVAGIPVPIYLAGAKLLDSFGLTPLIPNCGLFHAITGHTGQLSVAFTACRKMLPDPEFYSECLEESFAELKAAAASPAESKAKTLAKGVSKKTARKKASRKTTRKKTARRTSDTKTRN